jgi:RHS repeat-associated protein
MLGAHVAQGAGHEEDFLMMKRTRVHGRHGVAARVLAGSKASDNRYRKSNGLGRTSPCLTARKRGPLIGIVTFALVAAAGTALASTFATSAVDLLTSPIGTSGLSDNVAPNGGLRQAVELNLPTPRGNMQVPLSVNYTGAQQVGAAGVGWDVPLSYVEVTSNVSRHKPLLRPANYIPTPLAVPATRVILHLQGAEQIMVPTETIQVYRAFVADDYAELRVGKSGTWLYKTADGLTMTFSPLAAAHDSSRAYLTSIEDLTGNNKILLSYAVMDVMPAQEGSEAPAVVQEVLLSEVDYNFNLGATCARNQVRLAYVQRAFPPDEPPLALYVDEGHMRARTRVLSAIEIWEHETGACSMAPSELVRAYEFSYADDPDTQMPRLAQVDQRGAGVAPFSPGPTLPIARYDYGRVTSETGVKFKTASVLDLPSLPAKLTGGFGSLFLAGNALFTAMGFDDLTGDGVPDFYYPGTDVFDQSHPAFHAAYNRLSTGGPSLEGELVDPTNAIDRWPVGYGQQTTNERYEPYGYFYHPVTVTWQTMMDMNGDGVPDLVDSRAGRNPLGQHDSNYWAVRLFKPQANGAPMAYTDINVDVTRLKSEVSARHHDFDLGAQGHFIDDYNPEKYLPIARSQRTRIHSLFQCNDYKYIGGNWVKGPCNHPPPAEFERWSTLTEWKMLDVNGDGLPDFVLNSESVEAWNDYPCPSNCPATVPDTGMPAGCQGFCENQRNLEMAHPDQNQLLVFYNDGFALLGGSNTSTVKWSQNAAVLKEHAPCGLERHRNDNWSLGEDLAHTQFLQCGFAELNGDGIADYIDGPEDYVGGFDEDPTNPDYPRNGHYPQTAYLGTGLPEQYASSSPEFLYGTTSAQSEKMRAIPLPGPVDMTQNDEYRCGAENRDDFFLTQGSGLVDITADGVADYVFFGNWTDSPAGPKIELKVPLPSPSGPGPGNWWVMIGTGVGFRSPVPITMEGANGVTAAFGLLHVNTSCKSPYESRVIIGLVDIDGDGRKEVLNGHLNGDAIVSRLSGMSGGTNALDAGRLVRIGNGFGGQTLMTYGSAKTDESTPHLVPYPEIVVTEMAQNTTYSGTVLDPIRFAYGTAQQYYDPLRAAWQFPGYARKVTVAGSNESGPFHGLAIIEDHLLATDLADGHDKYTKVGRKKASYLIANVGNPDPRLLLRLDLPNKDLARAGVASTWKRAPLAESAATVDVNEECGDVRPYSATPAGDAQLCRHDAVALESARLRWEGTSAPGTNEVVQSFSQVQNFDNLGRPLRIRRYGDLAVLDDDVCEDLAYAVPTTAGAVLTTALASRRAGDCLDKTISVDRFRYGTLAEGQYSATLPLHLIHERRDTMTGAPISTVETETQTFDGFGNIIRTDRTRADGAVTTNQTTLNVFGTRPFVTTVQGTGTGALTTRLDYDPVTRAYTFTDQQGARWRLALDAFGRNSRYSRLDGELELPIKENYYNDDPAGPDGRTITLRTFLSTDNATVAADERMLFDDLGRAHAGEQLLGQDYGGTRLIVDETTYDRVGRPKFIADPYPSYEVFGAHYGTSYIYGDDGRITCQVRGVGYQTLTSTSAAADRYPSCVTYTYQNKRAIARVQGASDIVPGSSSFGVVEETTKTALGREISSVRGVPGTPLEKVEYTYDRFGNRIRVKRYAEPGNAASAVAQWDYTYDSLGQMLTEKEAGGARESRTYDDWGALVRRSWSLPGAPMDGSVRYAYDGLGRMTSEELVSQPAGSPTPLVTRRFEYHYDAAATDGRHIAPTNLQGRLSYVISPTRTTYLGYDEFGRQSAVTRTDTDETPPRLFTELSQRGPNGDLERLTFLLPDTNYTPESAVYRYDSAGRMSEIRWEIDGSESTRLFSATEIDPLGNNQEVQLGNGVIEHRSYRGDRRRELQDWSIQNAAGNIFSVTVDGYDGDDRQLGVRETTAGITHHKTFDYDALGRVKRARVTMAIGLPISDETFAYDGLGNLTQSVSTNGLLSVTRSFASSSQDPDRLCRLQTTAGAHVSPAVEGCTHTYDQRGNVTAVNDGVGPSRQFSYYTDGRVMSLSADNGAAGQVLYDGLGSVARVSVSGTVTGGRDDRRFGPLIEQSFFSSEGNQIERRIPGPSGILATKRGAGSAATTLYLHGEGASTQVVTDDTGHEVQHMDYSAFGHTNNQDVTGSSTYTKYQWNDGDVLAAFGINQIGARLYDPIAGRFLQRDPMVFEGGASAQNPYAFALNDPVNLSDPSGLAPIVVGRIYVIRGYINGEQVTYTGSTARELRARFSGHRWRTLIRAESTTITSYEVEAELNIARSSKGTFVSARTEALRVAEQKIMNSERLTGVRVLNERAAVAAERELALAERQEVRIGAATIFKGAGVKMGCFAGFALLDIYRMWREEKMKKYVMAPLPLEDEHGIFTLATGGWFFWPDHYKHYVRGFFAGTYQMISSDEYDELVEEAKSLWGYIDAWGDFEPGLLQPELPVYNDLN